MESGGSKRITASAYCVPLVSDHTERLEKARSRQKRPHHQRRHHKRRKIKTRRRRKAQWNEISEKDKSIFDPIVLADNVTLTQDQKEVCRLSDNFVPSPREPIDVCDMAVGTHAWAERLRWHRFHTIKRREKDEDIENCVDSHDNFQKTPWYKSTSKAAPTGDPELETFINSCSRDFMAKNKRRKIRDNMTPGQRKALKELKALPMTHNAACRYADKAGTTVITSLDEDDRTILAALRDKDYYEIVQENPTKNVITKIQIWSADCAKKGKLPKEIADYIADISTTRPGKCKPLIKTHKPRPFPSRLLLSGCGTPVEPLSKVVQASIRHLTEHLPYQIIDTKELLAKIKLTNEKLGPLPETACIAVCDVVSLYPNVNNQMGVPAVKRMLSDHPSEVEIPNITILQALDIALSNNFTEYTDGEQETVYAKPVRGTAMGPSMACDYVDVFMGELDNLLVSNSPVPLLSSIAAPSEREDLAFLDWSRYRDDGLAILPDSSKVDQFTEYLQSLHPPNIRWTVSHGQTAEYLDTRLTIKDGIIHSDVFSKHNHSYLPPNSCHPPSVFKGLIYGVGIRLRMLCSEDSVLQERIDEYARYFALAGWNKQKAKSELSRAAERDRDQLLTKSRRKKEKKLAWVTTYDPRLPSKGKIIRQNLHLLYTNPENSVIFPEGMLIAADRRRKNIGELYKPSVPKRVHALAPSLAHGFYPCNKCDTCAHAVPTTSFVSPWDGRRWNIRQHLTCTSKNVVYVLKCTVHPDEWYIGSTMDLKKRWANHKSDIKLKKGKKCSTAQHVMDKAHPNDPTLPFIQIFAVEAVTNPDDLLRRETWWMTNVGTLYQGLNTSSSLHVSLLVGSCQLNR
jgi:hypothetical protein